MSRNHDFEMQRGVAQILNNYGPGNVFDFGQLGLMMKTNPWRRVDPHNDVDEDRIADLIRSRVERFQNRTTSEDWADISAADIDVFKAPLRVEGGLFPPVFYCENTSCQKVHTAPEDNVNILPNDGRCEACGDELTQLPFVNVCECGKLEDPSPEEGCDDHGYQDYRLQKSSGGPATWRYKCRRCGSDMGGLSSLCFTCNNMQGPLPSGAGRIFYPQKVVEVDIPPVGVEPGDLPSGESWARVLMAVYLDNSHLAENTIEDLVTAEGDSETKRERYEELVEELGERKAKKMAEGLGVKLSGKDQLVKDTEHIILPDATDDADVGTRTLAYSNVGQQLFTFLSLIHIWRCRRAI